VKGSAVILTVMLRLQGLEDLLIVIRSMVLVCCFVAFWCLGLVSFLVIRSYPRLCGLHAQRFGHLLAALS